MINQIETDIVIAMKSRDQVRLGTLRMVLSELRNAQIELKAQGKEMDESEFLKVLAKEAKKRKESIEIFEKSGRQDLADIEKAELPIIEEYLPKQMDEAEVRRIVSEVVANASDKNFGMIMKAAMDALKGKADGKVVSKIVKELTA